jgi:O-methyltransferase involved in polyketide biosynthesis
LEPREPLIRNISDTARWAAVYRARESERKDALFRDPFARRLAGERGEQIAAKLPKGNRNTWSWVMRT